MTNALPDRLVRSALAGAATGGRTFTGLAAQSVTARADGTAVDAVLSGPVVRVAVGVLALGEIVADKLPQTPSRLAAPGLIGRLVFAAVCAVVVARRRPVAAPAHVPGEPRELSDGVDPELGPGPGEVAACVGTAVAASAGAAWVGVRWRAWAGRRIGRIPCALLEDVAVIGAAAVAARPS